MASVQAIAVRRFNAMERINKAKDALAESLGVDLPPQPKRVQGDMALAEAVSQEYVADTLEAIWATVDSRQAQGQEVDESGQQDESEMEQPSVEQKLTRKIKFK